MTSVIVSTLRTTLLQVPKFSVQSTAQLHQITSRLTAFPAHTAKEIAPGASLIPCGSLVPAASVGCGWFTQSIRHKIRNYYPRPRETKRHQWTWWRRMQTRGGRMVLMRKLIKGQNILAHPL